MRFAHVSHNILHRASVAGASKRTGWQSHMLSEAKETLSFMEEHAHLDPAQQPGSTGDMDPEAFRRCGHQVVDWIADYLQHAGIYPVLAQTTPGAIRQALPAQPPAHPEAMEAILA